MNVSGFDFGKTFNPLVITSYDEAWLKPKRGSGGGRLGGTWFNKVGNSDAIGISCKWNNYTDNCDIHPEYLRPDVEITTTLPDLKTITSGSCTDDLEYKNLDNVNGNCDTLLSRQRTKNCYLQNSVKVDNFLQNRNNPANAKQCFDSCMQKLNKTVYIYLKPSIGFTFECWCVENDCNSAYEIDSEYPNKQPLGSEF
jgi:hypothetical protein